MQAKIPRITIDAQARAWLDAMQTGNVRRQDDPALFIHFCPIDCLTAHLTPKEVYKNDCVLLGALDKSLAPQASSTGGQEIPKAILFIRIRHFAAVTRHTGRKIKGLHPFPQITIRSVIPNFF